MPEKVGDDILIKIDGHILLQYFKFVMRGRNMKKVFIHAYAAGNLGDDLLIRILCERYPKVHFKICADESYKERFKDIGNLSVYSPADKYVRLIDKVINRIKSTDRGFWKLLLKTSYATVHIGGSVFVQHHDDFGAAFRLDEELSARSKRIYVVGANFGPYTDEQYYRKYYELLQCYEGVCFRDRYSWGLFQELTNVVYAPDVVFNYKADISASEKKQVLISVIDMKNRTGKWGISQYDQSYKKFIVNLADEYIKRGYHVKFISFCKFQGDESAIEEIITLAGDWQKGRVSACYYEQDISQCIRSFAESEVIIGTRFHSVVLGWLMKKKVLPIVYDSKTKHMLEDNDCSFYLELSELDQDAGQIVQKIEEMKVLDIESLVIESAKQFQILDKVLSNEENI